MPPRRRGRGVFINPVHLRPPQPPPLDEYVEGIAQIARLARKLARVPPGHPTHQPTLRAILLHSGRLQRGLCRAALLDGVGGALDAICGARFAVAVRDWSVPDILRLLAALDFIRATYRLP